MLVCFVTKYPKTQTVFQLCTAKAWTSDHPALPFQGWDGITGEGCCAILWIAGDQIQSSVHFRCFFVFVCFETLGSHSAAGLAWNSPVFACWVLWLQTWCPFLVYFLHILFLEPFLRTGFRGGRQRAFGRESPPYINTLTMADPFLYQNQDLCHDHNIMETRSFYCLHFFFLLI